MFYLFLFIFKDLFIEDILFFLDMIFYWGIFWYFDLRDVGSFMYGVKINYIFMT